MGNDCGAENKVWAFGAQGAAVLASGSMNTNTLRGEDVESGKGSTATQRT